MAGKAELLFTDILNNMRKTCQKSCQVSDLPHAKQVSQMFGAAATAACVLLMLFRTAFQSISGKEPKSYVQAQQFRLFSRNRPWIVTGQTGKQGKLLLLSGLGLEDIMKLGYSSFNMKNIRERKDYAEKDTGLR